MPILFLACGQKNNHDKIGSPVNNIETKWTTSISDTVNIKNETNDLGSMKSFEMFRDFAVNYTLKRKPNIEPAVLVEAPDSVLEPIRIVNIHQPREFEKYLTLIFVKLFNAHLEYSKQLKSGNNHQLDLIRNVTP